MRASDFCLMVVLAIAEDPICRLEISLLVAFGIFELIERWRDRRHEARWVKAMEAERTRIAAIPTPVFDRLVAEGWRRRAASDEPEPIVVSREDYRAVRAELWEKRFFPVDMMMQWTPRSPFIVCVCVEVRCA